MANGHGDTGGFIVRQKNNLRAIIPEGAREKIGNQPMASYPRFEVIRGEE